MYDPTIGRWLEEDPAGFEAGDANLYRYGENDPTDETDPSGLESFETAMARKELRDKKPAIMEEKKQWFMKWYNREKNDMGWLRSIDIPPDTLSFTTRTISGARKDVGPIETKVPVLPAGWEWDSTFSMQVLGYHPHAAFGIRQKTPSSTHSGAQAMYDKNGKIITGGLSAGTADKVSPSYSFSGHQDNDVAPFDVAAALDTFYGGDTYRQKYIEVRPPNVSATAPRNIVN